MLFQMNGMFFPFLSFPYNVCSVNDLFLTVFLIRPWVVALFNGGRQFCGGSLLNSIHILTAAHCIAQ